MIFRQKTQKATIAFVVVMTAAPIAVLARNYLHSMESSLHENMQLMRAELTRSANKKHVLKAYSMRLGWDSSLKKFVDQHQESKTHWQTLSQRIQLRIIDSFNAGVKNRSDISSASLEWLDSIDSDFHTWGNAQQAWLTASVSSVPHAMELIASIEDMANPFPLLAEGCSYQQSQELIGVNLQCLLTLITWELPMVFSQVEGIRSSSAQAAHPAAHPATRPTTLPPNHSKNQWRLFRSKTPVPNFANAGSRKVLTDDDHKKTALKGLTDKLATAPMLKTNPSRGVIIGPAGTLVLNAITE